MESSRKKYSRAGEKALNVSLISPLCGCYVLYNVCHFFTADSNAGQGRDGLDWS